MTIWTDTAKRKLVAEPFWGTSSDAPRMKQHLFVKSVRGAGRKYFISACGQWVYQHTMLREPPTISYDHCRSCERPRD